MELAKQTVEIVERGSYVSASGRTVDIATAVSECRKGTRFYPPEDLKRIRWEVLAQPAQGFSTTFEVVNETTLAGIARLASSGKAKVAALNFASAKNPGGGFLKNAGAAANNRPEELAQIPDVFQRRCEYILALAASQDYTHLVLGAWGCGVFRNDPEVVAGAFASHLRRGAWGGRFEHVLISVLDSSPSQDTFSAFQRAMMEG